MDSCLPTSQPKDLKLWRFRFPTTDYMSLGELLKECWGLPALKIVKDDSVVLLAPVRNHGQS